MAGDWIKMRGNLWDDPRIGRLSDLTGATEAQVIGSLYWLWTSADQHTENGFMPGLSLRQIDRKTGLQGFGAALVDIGWVEDGQDGITILNFSEHNGASAKRRCMDAQRKANDRAGVRDVSASDADIERKVSDNSGQVAELEKEKRREEITNTDPSDLVESPSAPRPAACPTQQLLDLYHTFLPMLPRVEVLNDGRRRALSARWREVITDPDIRKAQDPREAALEWFAWFFEHASHSRFLTGKTKDWRADLDFLMTQSKFAKVVEGHYHKDIA